MGFVANILINIINILCSNVSAYYTVLGSPRKITLTIKFNSWKFFFFLSDLDLIFVYQERLSVEGKISIRYSSNIGAMV
ncbi:Uncharacterised protein [Escherichia coli]|uniref:Uncharacterized protein n=1 Tax=Escherichia coli TaxID=562 RepID=A0A376MPG9_ECOLX|nr:Uncharacterised protein [Escherichia coli]